MKIAGKNVREDIDQTGHVATAPSDGEALVFDASQDMWIPGTDKGIRIVGTPVTGDLAYFDGTDWVPLASGEIPVSVAGVTATTLNAALLEIFSAI